MKRTIAGALLLFPVTTAVLVASWADLPLSKRVQQARVVVLGRIVRVDEPVGNTNAYYQITAWIKVRDVLWHQTIPADAGEKDARKVQSGDEIPLTMPGGMPTPKSIVYTNGTDGFWILEYRDQRYWASYPKDYQPLSKGADVRAAIASVTTTNAPK